jgi:hypothetical protein
LTSGEDCHQNVVQKGLPSTSPRLTPTASSATLLISITVPAASSRPTNCTIESSAMRAIFSRIRSGGSPSAMRVPWTLTLLLPGENDVPGGDYRRRSGLAESGNPRSRPGLSAVYRCSQARQNAARYVRVRTLDEPSANVRTASPWVRDSTAVTALTLAISFR